MKLIISIKEARKLLGTDANGMSDEEILHVIETLHSLAKNAIEDAKVRLRRKKDAKALANVIYDVYKDKKKKERG